ncbi:deazaflavin-dependent oxidoreductase, nitroreductase family [Paraoerskovia marina]|uniref:Deazaflavin-dependent oxidoreductase, nitroreductase family n=1 Tax=Paraoerskovia marina TaxID=545619 RepID=A0A1H1PYP4_9CELL|nr:nitroreductase family deazaflavin-dependent oxidoreductase [Paraoerskovia marina]SDS16481.1 deazaflavin-dependent oxidoreductase, nitroreductase family [Paraoerskovia marina]
MPLDAPYSPSPDEFVRNQVEFFESSGGTQGNTMRDVPIIVLWTLGARSGALRKTPLMRVEHDGSYAVVASQGGGPKHPVWYRNICAHDLVELQDGAERRDYRAREVTGEEKALWWDRAVAVWPDYAEYQTRTEREIPVIVLEAV